MTDMDAMDDTEMAMETEMAMDGDRWIPLMYIYNVPFLQRGGFFFLQMSNIHLYMFYICTYMCTMYMYIYGALAACMAHWPN